jgi:hypothetical protein
MEAASNTGPAFCPANTDTLQTAIPTKAKQRTTPPANADGANGSTGRCAPGRFTRPPASVTTVNSTASDGTPVRAIWADSRSIAANADSAVGCLLMMV